MWCYSCRVNECTFQCVCMCLYHTIQWLHHFRGKTMDMRKKKVMTQFCVCSPDYWVRPWSAVTYSKFIINQNDVEIPFVRKMFSQHVMTCPHHSSLNRTMMTCTVLYLITMLTSTQLCKSIICEQQHQTMVLGSVCCVVCIHIPDLLNI